MRGTLILTAGFPVDNGIIPAYAGNTDQMMIRIADFWDHPRVCGEHPRSAHPIDSTSGSSPRMRGTLSVAVVDHEEFVDHPRVCGEHFAQPSPST